MAGLWRQAPERRRWRRLLIDDHERPFGQIDQTEGDRSDGRDCCRGEPSHKLEAERLSRPLLLPSHDGVRLLLGHVGEAFEEVGHRQACVRVPRRACTGTRVPRKRATRRGPCACCNASHSPNHHRGVPPDRPPKGSSLSISREDRLSPNRSAACRFRACQENSIESRLPTGAYPCLPWSWPRRRRTGRRG